MQPTHWEFDLTTTVSIAETYTPTDIRSFRRRLGLKQDALAEMLGVDQATVSRWERGQSPVDLSAFARLQTRNVFNGPFADTDLDNVWPALLKFYRSVRGMSQEQLADVLNCSAYSVSRWECGKFKPDLGAQVRLRDLVLSPLESDSQVRRMVDRIKASPGRFNVNWGSLTLAWSSRLQLMNAQIGRSNGVLADVKELHEGKYQEWWTKACKVGFAKGEVPYAYGYWRYSELDARRVSAFPAGTYDGAAIWVTFHQPLDIEAAGRSDGEVVIRHADELVG